MRIRLHAGHQALSLDWSSMDNASRSERTRNAVIRAALVIIARDGPGRLTLDAIAREGGISKGGLMHQFPTKGAVLKALLEHQIEHFDRFSRRYMAEHGTARRYPQLAMQIATMREASAGTDPIAFALLAAITQEPDLLASVRDIDSEALEAIKAEAADPELAALRWAAAHGLVLSSLLGTCPFSREERSRLFDRLLEDEQWPDRATATKSPAKPSPLRKSKHRGN